MLPRYLSGRDCGKPSSFYRSRDYTADKVTLKTYKDDNDRDYSDERCRKNHSPISPILSMK